MTITDENGCTATLSGIVVQSLVSANEPDWAAAVGIFPNPTSGLVQIVLPESWRSAQTDLAVYDLVGRKVSALHSTGANKLTLDLQAAPAGVYTLVMQVDKRQIVRKIVKSE